MKKGGWGLLFDPHVMQAHGPSEDKETFSNYFSFVFFPPLRQQNVFKNEFYFTNAFFWGGQRAHMVCLLPTDVRASQKSFGMPFLTSKIVKNASKMG